MAYDREMGRSVGCAFALALLLAAPSAAAKSTDREWTVEVGPIWNQIDAESKCPKAAGRAGATWTGKWWTTKPGRMSMCELKGARASNLRWLEPAKAVGGAKVDKLPSGKFSVEAGPTHAQIEAEMKCPRAVGSVGGKWTGQWWTTQMGRMSVCEFTR